MVLGRRARLHSQADILGEMKQGLLPIDLSLKG